MIRNLAIPRTGTIDLHEPLKKVILRSRWLGRRLLILSDTSVQGHLHTLPRTRRNGLTHTRFLNDSAF